VSVLTDQRAELARTPQSIVTLGVRQCQNWYAQRFGLGPPASDSFDNGLWQSSGVTVTPNTYAAPDGSLTADTVAFAAVNDYTYGWPLFGLATNPAAASKAFTASVWLRTASGTGTFTLYITDSTNTESSSVLCNLTTTWQRFSIHRLFTAGAVLYPAVRLEREAGDLASIVAWRGNVTENPTNANAPYLWPSVGTDDYATVNRYASSCTAPDLGDGARCYYSFPTCQDKANFNPGNFFEATAALKGIREFRFCMKNAPAPLGGEPIRPLILSLDHASQKIDPEKSITVTERVSVKMEEDNAPGLWDADKATQGAKVNTPLEQGTFFRRFLAIYKNYANPDCYGIVKRGFVAAGMTEALYEQRGRYLIQNISFDSSGNPALNLTDRLKLLRKNIPAKISTTNLLRAAIDNAVTTIPVDDASEFSDPPTDGSYKVTILIDTEKMNVTARDLTANTLTVDGRARWGTAAASHVNNSAIKELAEFGTERTTPTLTPLGMKVMDAVIMLVRMGGIAAADIDSAGLQTQGDTWFPGSVDPATGIVTGTLFRRTVTDQLDLEKLLTEVREVLMLDIFVGENQSITGHLFAPALPTVSLPTLTDDANLLADSISVDDNDESRLTRVIVAYDLATGAKGDTVGDYNDGVVEVEPELESVAGYGEQRMKIILSQWIGINDSATATKAAAHILGRYRQGVRKVAAAIDLKDDTVKTGDFVLVTTKRLQKATGATDSNRQMLVVSKEPQDDGTINLQLVDAVLPGRPGFIAPAGYPDYDSASFDQRRYCYIGTAGANKVGAASDDGYTIY
jgi:hypothetical protein